MRTSRKRIVTAGLVAALMGPSVAPITTTALAETNDEYVGMDASYSERVEACTTAYHEAQDRLDELNGQIEANQGRVSEIEAQLPQLRQRAALTVRSQYKLTQSGNGMLDLLLSATDFNEFLSTLQYLDIIQRENYEAIDDLVTLSNELAVTRSALDAERQEVSDQVALAQQALDDAEEAREAARQAAIARTRAEEQQRQAALEAARNRQGSTYTTASGREAVVEAPSTQAPVSDSAPSNEQILEERKAEEEAKKAEAAQKAEEAARIAEEAARAEAASNVEDAAKKAEEAAKAAEEAAKAEEAARKAEEAARQAEEAKAAEEARAATPSSDSRSQFIETWAPRIDAFNAGYPLEGYGSTFAAAAYDYGVDPRWSPAIARIESSSGLYCFADHNAWGWGASEWPDWDTAITDHVAGLGRGYGYTLTYDAAATYCPPNADLWYSSVQGSMQSIWPTDTL